MKRIYLFPKTGTINQVFNDFAQFLAERKSLSEATEIKFVEKLESLSGSTNSPMSLLNQRIRNNEINYSELVWSKSLIDEMKDVIARHSRKPKQLGYLPPKLRTVREDFIISLWRDMLKSGVKYKKETKTISYPQREKNDEYVDVYTNTLPAGYDNDNFGEYIMSLSDKIRPEKEKGTKRWIVSFWVGKIGYEIKFTPTSIADLVYRIGDKAELNYTPPPPREDDFSIFNPKLVALLKPFVSEDELRPSWGGINFDQNGATVTDGNILLQIQNQPDRLGLFKPDTKPLNENFPKYESLLNPESPVKWFTITVEYLIAYTKQALKYANKVTHGIAFIAPFEREIGFNGKLLVKLLDFYKKTGNTTVEVGFYEKLSRREPIFIMGNTEFGKAKSLLMPMLLWESYTFQERLKNQIAVEDLDYSNSFKGLYFFEKDAAYLDGERMRFDAETKKAKKVTTTNKKPDIQDKNRVFVIAKAKLRLVKVKLKLALSLAA